MELIFKTLPRLGIYSRYFEIYWLVSSDYRISMYKIYKIYIYFGPRYGILVYGMRKCHRRDRWTKENNIGIEIYIQLTDYMFIGKE